MPLGRPEAFPGLLGMLHTPLKAHMAHKAHCFVHVF